MTHSLSAQAVYLYNAGSHLGREWQSARHQKGIGENSKAVLKPTCSFKFISGRSHQEGLGLRSRNWISRPTSILYQVWFSLQGRVSLTFIKYLPPTKHFARHGMCLFLSNLLSIMGICHLHFIRDEIESENGETVSQEKIQNACLCFRGLPRPTSLYLSFIHLFLSLATLITFRYVSFFLPQNLCTCYSFFLEPFCSFLAYT